MNDITSYENVFNRWVPEILHWRPEIPILLCGTKIDLREDYKAVKELLEKGSSMVTTEEGEFLAKSVGCVGYVEMSAKIDYKSVRNVYYTAVRCACSDVKPKDDNRCVCS